MCREIQCCFDMSIQLNKWVLSLFERSQRLQISDVWWQLVPCCWSGHSKGSSPKDNWLISWLIDWLIDWLRYRGSLWLVSGDDVITSGNPISLPVVVFYGWLIGGRELSGDIYIPYSIVYGRQYIEELLTESYNQLYIEFVKSSVTPTSVVVSHNDNFLDEKAIDEVDSPPAVHLSSKGTRHNHQREVCYSVNRSLWRADAVRWRLHGWLLQSHISFGHSSFRYVITKRTA